MPQPIPPALVGGIPNTSVDIPISAVLLALLIGLAASHMTIFQRNRKRSHKFLFSAMFFGFCMSRIVALVFRIAWATQPTNTNIAIVAQVFLNAGILLIYIINNLLVQRMLRAALPELGWNKWFRGAYKAVLWVILPVLLMLIVVVVQSLKVEDPATKKIDRDVQLAALTYITVVAVLPLFVLPVAVFWPRKNKAADIDHFGAGNWHAKAGILMLTSVLAAIEAGFRCGTSWEAPVPATMPEWFHSKAAFYCFNFVIDILLASVFLVGRADKRFHIPDGSNGSYAARREELEAQQAEKSRSGTDPSDEDMLQEKA